MMYIRAPLEIYHGRDESNFDFELATLRTGEPQALRTRVNAAQSQQCFRSEKLKNPNNCAPDKTGIYHLPRKHTATCKHPSGTQPKEHF